MKCIFCKENSENSKSVEHIIPESLGNRKAILPKGIVCDSCNNYFARKIEKELLEMSFYKSLRSRYGIESKKGKIPLDVGYLPVTGSEIEVELNGVFNPDNKTLNVNIPKRSDFNKIFNGEIKEIYIPLSHELKKSVIVSRFLAKIGIEVIAYQYWKYAKDVNYLITEDLFNPLRYYARYGNGIKFWDYNQRRIYNEVEDSRQKMYEFKIWSTEDNDNALGLHLTLVLYGLEFTINLFEPSINRYKKWLVENAYRVPI